ncbi:hypothetical protein BGW38_008814, partial [Lunasporangiospora selenospora]
MEKNLPAGSPAGASIPLNIDQLQAQSIPVSRHDPPLTHQSSTSSVATATPPMGSVSVPRSAGADSLKDKASVIDPESGVPVVEEKTADEILAQT